MSFFEQQHKARKRTGRLVGLFLIAVALTVTALNAAVYLVARYSTLEDQALPLEDWMSQPYWLWISGATILVIVGGSLRTLFKLSGGGKSVAQMVGARRIKMSSQEPGERELINVVEEMSIASGTPVPALYVMDDENRINAFVAGYRPNQAVLVVTRGTLDILDRDELQGVVGHEYSHILNGDMRMNIRLMATLAGILVLGQLWVHVAWYALLWAWKRSGANFGVSPRAARDRIPRAVLRTDYQSGHLETTRVSG